MTLRRITYEHLTAEMSVDVLNCWRTISMRLALQFVDNPLYELQWKQFTGTAGRWETVNHSNGNWVGFFVRSLYRVRRRVL